MEAGEAAGSVGGDMAFGKVVGSADGRRGGDGADDDGGGWGRAKDLGDNGGGVDGGKDGGGGAVDVGAKVGCGCGEDGLAAGAALESRHGNEDGSDGGCGKGEMLTAGWPSLAACSQAEIDGEAVTTRAEADCCCGCNCSRSSFCCALIAAFTLAPIDRVEFVGDTLSPPGDGGASGISAAGAGGARPRGHSDVPDSSTGSGGAHGGEQPVARVVRARSGDVAASEGGGARSASGSGANRNSDPTEGGDDGEAAGAVCNGAVGSGDGLGEVTTRAIAVGAAAEGDDGPGRTSDGPMAMRSATDATASRGSPASFVRAERPAPEATRPAPSLSAVVTSRGAGCDGPCKKSNINSSAGRPGGGGIGGALERGDETTGLGGGERDATRPVGDPGAVAEAGAVAVPATAASSRRAGGRLGKAGSETAGRDTVDRDEPLLAGIASAAAAAAVVCDGAAGRAGAADSTERSSRGMAGRPGVAQGEANTPGAASLAGSDRAAPPALGIAEEGLVSSGTTTLVPEEGDGRGCCGDQFGAAEASRPLTELSSPIAPEFPEATAVATASRVEDGEACTLPRSDGERRGDGENCPRRGGR